MPNHSHPLDPLFRPETVAVIGASATPGSVGSIVMRNLTENPFNGVVYPINQRRRAVHGVHCYPKIADAPEPIDLAVIATPAATVPGLVQECVEAGAKGAIVISAGFAELGEEGRKLERKVLDIARGRLRIIGPNCLGVIHPRLGFNASFAAATPSEGHIALLSQSGAICTSILDWAREVNIGFSAFVSVGSMIDVDFGDLIDYFGEDPHTRSIILYMESIGDVRQFLSAARAVARTKPIIVVKSGRHEAGARAAASHTGALAGADAVFDAAFRRAGVLRVATISELFNMAEILAAQPVPRGPALAIVTNAGGPGVMATDALMLQGGKLARLSPETQAALDLALPPFWSHANPIDILGDATPERYRKAIESVARDPGVEGILVLLTPQPMTDPTDTARQLLPFARLSKPILASWMGAAGVREGRRILDVAGFPTFDSPEEAVQAFLHMVQYQRNQELLYETPEVVADQVSHDAARVRRLLEGARREERTLLTETEAKEILAAYGIPVTPTVDCRTADEAAAAANRLGYPVVVKLRSRTITHKSDVGGVQLDLRDEAAVRRAFETIQAKLAERGQPDAFDGVTVQTMVRVKGHELIIGSSIDRQFGPVILFGAGGVLVEVFQDRALALPPLNRVLARRLMERTLIYQALRGVRGMQRVDLKELESLLVRFSQLVADFPEIAEIDINPLLAGAERIIALDARVLLTPPDLPEHEKPRLAIMPYPNQYIAPFRLDDGTELLVRPIRPEDEPLIVEFHEGHSEQTLRMRFFGLVRTLSRASLIRLCHLDYDRELALVAIHSENRQPHIAGVSRYYLRPETGEAEFAVVIGDPWQRRGLGTHLMQRLISIARERGVKRLVGQVLAENDAMRRLVTRLGFHIEPTQDSSVVVAVLDLASGEP
jgi:acetyltransferase